MSVIMLIYILVLCVIMLSGYYPVIEHYLLSVSSTPRDHAMIRVLQDQPPGAGDNNVISIKEG